MDAVSIILLLTGSYAVAGLIFAVAFAARGAGAIDPLARHATLTFRLLVIPATAALWPSMMRKWRAAARKASA